MTASAPPSIPTACPKCLQPATLELRGAVLYVGRCACGATFGTVLVGGKPGPVSLVRR